MRKRRIRIYNFYATYLGKHRHMKTTGITGEVIPGKEYKVSKKIGQSLALTTEWKVQLRYSYKEIK